MELKLIALTLFFTVIVVLILREFWCWYYKINKRIDLLTRNNFLLEKFLEHSGVPLNKIFNNSEKSITVRFIPTGKVMTVPISEFDDMKKRHGETSYEIIEHS